MKPKDENFSPKEAQKRFEAALRGGLSTPPQSLKNISPKRQKPPQKGKKGAKKT